MTGCHVHSRLEDARALYLNHCTYEFVGLNSKFRIIFYHIFNAEIIFYYFVSEIYGSFSKLYLSIKSNRKILLKRTLFIRSGFILVYTSFI